LENIDKALARSPASGSSHFLRYYLRLVQAVHGEQGPKKEDFEALIQDLDAVPQARLEIAWMRTVVEAYRAILAAEEAEFDDRRQKLLQSLERFLKELQDSDARHSWTGREQITSVNNLWRQFDQTTFQNRHEIAIDLHAGLH
jgi:hypothetical protein